MTGYTPPAVLRFLGAAATVTGSRFLLEYPSGRLLVDCGMYQGDRQLRRRNWAPFPVPVDSIDAVVLSHAHLDHTGWLPRLVRQGFRGPVYCSPWTAQLAPIVLRDAAHLQEEDAEFAAQHGHSRHRPPLPLFDTQDAEAAIALLRPCAYGQDSEVLEAVSLRLRLAGHILGSSTVQLRTPARSVVFSGDLGRADHPLLNPPEPPPAADAIVVESTYGDRQHPPRRLDAVADAIRRTLARGGVVLIPAFAVDRTEVLLMALRDLMRAGQIPSVPVFVDSPMALAALQVYRQAVAEHAPEVRDTIGAGGDPFDPGDLHLVHSAAESARLDESVAPCILVSASGMATGGRVVHHLARLAPEPQNLVLLPGFQVPGTRGRALLDGATSLKMFGGYVPVRAEVLGTDEMSAHADADGLLDWLRRAPVPPRTCYVVHGEPAPAAALAARIERELRWCAVVPRLDEQVLV